MSDNKPGEQGIKTEILKQDLNQIIEMVKSVRYGSVTIIIQDHRVMQIEKNEKIRMK